MEIVNVCIPEKDLKKILTLAKKAGVNSKSGAVRYCAVSYLNLILRKRLKKNGS
jgi:hypothetical protein